MTLSVLLTLIAAFLVSGAATGALIPLLVRMQVVDTPNARSSHSTPVPRGGGLGILLGLAAGLAVAAIADLPLPAKAILAGAAAVAAVSFVDDSRQGGLAIRWRLLTQTLAAVWVAIQCGPLPRVPLPAPLDLPLAAFAIPATVLWIVAVTNIYNFLDGIDGYAAVQGLLAGLTLALFDPAAFAGVGLALAGGCAGFLLHNWHPARIFMGDTGSATLGFLIAALPLMLPEPSRSPAVFVVILALWFFLSDGIFTLLRRAYDGERFWEPHRTHLYQLLVRAGLHHHQVVTRIAVPAAVLCALAALSVRFQQAAFSWTTLGVAIVSFAVYRRWATH